ncbi:MAG: hypothetical protein JXA89_28105 [Anaerolineae bacterium]|nr:hypothetical protein [Anaerolineae bacterium]
MFQRLACAILALFIILTATEVVVWADDGQPQSAQDISLWPVALAWLVPLGLGVLACGAVPPEQTSAVIRVGWLAVSVTVIGYWLCGFAFQFGGAGFFFAHDPGLAGLKREWVWKLSNAAWAGGGVLGLEGYMLRGAASTPSALELFFAQLPWMTTAVAIPLWSLQGRAKPVAMFLGGTLAAFVYSMLGNWTWGGGWLATMGSNAQLGHGFVDFGGVGAVYLAGASSALAGMLAFGARSYARSTYAGTVTDLESEPYVSMPGLHLPVLATIGAWLVIVGWIGWGASTPFAVVSGLESMSILDMSIGTMLAVAGGAFVSGTYSWLVTGQANTLMVARGALGALVAVGAGVPFMPFWAALALGAGVGLMVPLVQYVVEHLFRIDDSTSVIATYAIPALCGLLAVGLLTDGHAGQSWNQADGSSASGIAGYWAAPGAASDWPGQFQAQVIGIIAVVLVSFVLSWILFAAIQELTRAWQGEYTIRLPRHASVERDRASNRKWRWPHIRFVRSGVEQASDREPEPESGFESESEPGK